MVYNIPIVSNVKDFELFQNMSEQTHLLIAGATGSGKSVILNGFICNLLLKSPNQAQFILIDPKRVELATYKNTPHCLKYASEQAEMLTALKQAINLIENRYKKMQLEGVKKYNGAHVYVIIDELADLMTTNAKEVAPILQRIAQIGRAAGVHLVACTQRPTSEVIPSKILVNIDSRLALHTRNKQDSRNIIGVTGAELLNIGTALYYTPESDEPSAVTVPYITDEQQNELAQFWSAQHKIKHKIFKKLYA